MGPKHGGARANAGRPISTGSKATPVVSFRLSKRTYEALECEAKRLGSRPNLVAQWVTERWIAGRVAGADV